MKRNSALEPRGAQDLQGQFKATWPPIPEHSGKFSVVEGFEDLRLGRRVSSVTFVVLKCVHASVPRFQ